MFTAIELTLILLALLWLVLVIAASVIVMKINKEVKGVLNVGEAARTKKAMKADLPGKTK